MTRRERAAAKRRKAAEARAIDYLKTALTDLPGRRKGTAEKRICESAQPMSTARAIVREWRKQRPSEGSRPAIVDESAVPDLSAATEARATLLRRQHPDLRRWPAYDDEIGELERALLSGRISQRAFDTKCGKIAGCPMPEWMRQAQQHVTREDRGSSCPPKDFPGPKGDVIADGTTESG